MPMYKFTPKHSFFAPYIFTNLTYADIFYHLQFVKKHQPNILYFHDVQRALNITIQPTNVHAQRYVTKNRFSFSEHFK